jgi:hypothetical protein
MSAFKAAGNPTPTPDGAVLQGGSASLHFDVERWALDVDSFPFFARPARTVTKLHLVTHLLRQLHCAAFAVVHSRLNCTRTAEEPVATPVNCCTLTPFSPRERVINVS